MHVGDVSEWSAAGPLAFAKLAVCGAASAAREMDAGPLSGLWREREAAAANLADELGSSTCEKRALR